MVPIDFALTKRERERTPLIMAAVESSNSYTWLAVILSVLTFIYWQGLSRYNSILGGSPLRGPKVWPWIGNLLDIFKYGGIHKMFLNYFRKYGRVHTMCFGRTPVIVVSDPEIVKQILVKDFYKFPNRPTFIKPNPPLDSGLFQAENGKWKRIRTTVAPTFTASKLKEIVPIIDDASQKLMAKMETFAETGKSDILGVFIELRNNGNAAKPLKKLVSNCRRSTFLHEDFLS